MKITKAVYTTESSRVLTKKEFIESLFLAGETKVSFAPKSWVFLGLVEIDIPDKAYYDIIGANTETDIEKQIAKHEAEITKLVEFRNRGK